MDDREREHPDEGTIHAWLDGALDDGASRALEAHVAGCRACAERVAEARGLIAGASRIVSALDDAPSGAGPAWGQAPAAPVAAAAAPTIASRRWWRVTPTRAAIAATVLVALGVSLTYERASVDSAPPRPVAERATALSTSPAAPLAAPVTAPLRDPLLDSAVKRNIAAAHPPRAVEPAPGPAVPLPRTADDRAMAAATRADSTAAPTSRAAAGITAGSAVAQAAGSECYRVESANGVAATFGVEPLPLVVRIDSAGRATMFTVAGQATTSQVAVTRAGDDSLLLRLRRLGYEGTLALGAPGEARAGVMRSRPLQIALEEQVVTAAPKASTSRARPSQREPAAKEAVPPQAAASPEARSALDAAPAVPVVARRTSCPR